MTVLAAPPAGPVTIFVNGRLLVKLTPAAAPAPTPWGRPPAHSLVVGHIMVVRGGRIEAIERHGDLNRWPDAEIVDLKGATVIPGLVMAETNLAEGGRDDEQALTPQVRALDGFDFHADHSALIKAGITTVQISPGSRRLMPGQGAVVKLGPGTPAQRTLRTDESLRLILSSASRNPPRLYLPPVGAVSVEKPLEPTKPQLARDLGSAVAGLQALLKAARDNKDEARRDPVLAALAEQLGRKGPWRITANTLPEIQAALRLARDFGLRFTLVDPVELPPLDEELAEWSAHVSGVILSSDQRPGQITNPPIPDPDAPPSLTPGERLQRLASAKLPVAFKPAADADLKDTLYLSGLLTSSGVSPMLAVGTVTADAAAVLGVADRVGTLAPGRDADFVVLDGPLFGPQTRVKTVYIDGQPVYAAVAKPAVHVFHAKRLFTGTGEVIADGSVLIEGRTIRGLGRDVSIPPEAQVTNLSHAVIVPGFIDLGTTLGFGGTVANPVPINTKLADKLLTADPAYELVRQGGVTTVCFAGPGTAATPVLAFKLGQPARALADPVAVKFTISGNLTTVGSTLRDTLRQGKAYAEAWAKYESAYAEYEKQKAAYDAANPKPSPSATPKEEPKKEEPKPSVDSKEEPKKDDAKKEESKKEDPKKDEPKKEEPKKPAEPQPPEKPQVAEALEPYRLLFANKIPALVEARRIDALALALAIFRDEMKLRTVVVGADDAFRLPPARLQDPDLAFVVGPTLVREVDRQTVNLAQQLANLGAPFAFQSQAGTGAGQLPRAVQYAVRVGLGPTAGLQGLTAHPARLLGLGTVGSLAVGKDADLVVLSGSPFEASSKVLGVMVDGKWVYSASEAR
jgi:imidazolonepropionase-like amidohydrolase